MYAIAHPAIAEAAGARKTASTAKPCREDRNCTAAVFHDIVLESAQDSGRFCQVTAANHTPFVASFGIRALSLQRTHAKRTRGVVSLVCDGALAQLDYAQLPLAHSLYPAQTWCAAREATAVARPTCPIRECSEAPLHTVRVARAWAASVWSRLRPPTVNPFTLGKFT